jgi:hypothetical protein
MAPEAEKPEPVEGRAARAGSRATSYGYPRYYSYGFYAPRPYYRHYYARRHYRRY